MLDKVHDLEHSDQEWQDKMALISQAQLREREASKAVDRLLAREGEYEERLKTLCRQVEEADRYNVQLRGLLDEARRTIRELEEAAAIHQARITRLEEEATLSSKTGRGPHEEDDDEGGEDEEDDLVGGEQTAKKDDGQESADKDLSQESEQQDTSKGRE